MQKQKIALALSTGGARGIAHIGVIEELQKQNFEITSIAGSSMGALIGAAYASGNLEKCKELLISLKKHSMFGLADWGFNKGGFLKGKKIMKALGSIIPNCMIEELPINFAAIATDVNSSQEVVFDRGSLHDAIRASISLPMIFEPVSQNGMLLIDGGIINPLPLNRVKRTEGDLLVGVAVSAPRGTSAAEANASQAKPSYNRVTLLTESTTIMVQKLIRNTIEKYQPDLIITIPAQQYGTQEFHRAAEIIEEGRRATLNYLNSLLLA